MPEFLSEFSKSEAYGIMVMQIALSPPGAIISSYLTQTCLGRKYTGCISYILAGLCFIPFFITRSKWAVIVFTCPIYFFVGSGFAAMYTMGSESFPTETRVLGMGIANIFTRVGGISSPIVTGLLLEYDNGIELSFLLYGISFCSIGTSLLFLKETTLKIKKIVNESKEQVEI